MLPTCSKAVWVNNTLDFGILILLSGLKKLKLIPLILKLWYLEKELTRLTEDSDQSKPTMFFLGYKSDALTRLYPDPQPNS